MEIGIELKCGAKRVSNPTAEDIRSAVLSSKDGAVLTRSDGATVQLDFLLGPMIRYSPANQERGYHAMGPSIEQAIQALTGFSQGDAQWADGIKLKQNGMGCLMYSAFKLILLCIMGYAVFRLFC